MSTALYQHSVPALYVRYNNVDRLRQINRPMWAHLLRNCGTSGPGNIKSVQALTAAVLDPFSVAFWLYPVVHTCDVDVL